MINAADTGIESPHAAESRGQDKPISGPTGTSVKIIGQSLTQTTRVTFAGVKATFTVNSDTQVTATVPTGAKTGKIEITTPGGNATSSVTFTVTE